MYKLKTIIPVFLFVLSLLSLSGCWETDGLDLLDEMYPPDGDADLDAELQEIDLGEVSGEGLPGRWAMKMTLHGTIKPLSTDLDLSLTNYFIADINEDGSLMRLTFCQQDSDINAEFAKSELLDETAEKLRETLIDVPLEGAGDKLPANTVGWTWGVQMEDPINDSFPTEKDDSRIFDQDEDGNPGVSVHIVLGDATRYMARRSVWNLSDGVLTADKDGQKDQWILGTIDTFQIDEKAVGASDPMYEATAPINPVLENNLYIMKRVPGGAMPNATDGDITDGDVVDGDNAPDGDTTDGDVTDGDTAPDGDITDGDVADGDTAPDGDTTDGDVVDGDTTPDGDTTDGDVVDGDITPDGDTTDGDVVDGDTAPDGDTTDGDLVDGDTIPDGDITDGDVTSDGVMESVEAQESDTTKRARILDDTGYTCEDLLRDRASLFVDVPTD